MLWAKQETLYLRSFIFYNVPHSPYPNTMGLSEEEAGCIWNPPKWQGISLKKQVWMMEAGSGT